MRAIFVFRAFRISYLNCTQVLMRYFVTYLNINANVQSLKAHLQLKMT